jgi:hypothetical protein
MEEQLAALARSLRALERDALTRLPEAPWLHVKRVLADHAAEDAASAAALGDRTGAAAADPVDPVPDRRGLQARLADDARALRDATGDERLVQVLIELELRQRRHLDELPPPRVAIAPGPRDPFVRFEPGAPPDPLDEAVRAAEAAAREGDTATAAERMREAAALDAERTRDGDPWGLRPVDPG